MLMNQAVYAHTILSQASNLLKELSTPHPTKSLVGNLLEWVASTLDSSDAFLLSWPDNNGLMYIREPAFLTTPTLTVHKSIKWFEMLEELERTDEQESLAFSTTANIRELQEIGIESVIITKVIAHGKAEFTGKGLLVVCNRKKPASGKWMYFGYDLVFLNIVKLILQMHISELYLTAYERYISAKQRYRDAQIVSSLMQVGRTALDLLEVYGRYSAAPSIELLNNCLNSYITLFAANQIKANELRALLGNFEEFWLPKIQERQKQAKSLMRYIIARGYFVLGVQDSADWLKGRQVLILEKGNLSPSDVLLGFEKAYAHWWQIYSRCQRIKNDPEYTSNFVQELNQSFVAAQAITKVILWRYLIQNYDKESLSLVGNKAQMGVRITSSWLLAYFGYLLLDGSETIRKYQFNPVFPT